MFVCVRVYIMYMYLHVCLCVCACVYVTCALLKCTPLYIQYIYVCNLLHFTDVDITNTTPTIVTAAVNTSSVIRFGCRASGVPMVTNIQWSYPQDIVFQQQLPRVTPDNASVTRHGDVIGRIEFKHTGWYICTATNNVTRKSVVFRLMVKGKNYIFYVFEC